VQFTHLSPAGLDAKMQDNFRHNKGRCTCSKREKKLFNSDGAGLLVVGATFALHARRGRPLAGLLLASSGRHAAANRY
jgi:hypothetical protein